MIPRPEHADPVEMRHCEGCGEDYNAFEESHVGHEQAPHVIKEARLISIGIVNDPPDPHTRFEAQKE